VQAVLQAECIELWEQRLRVWLGDSTGNEGLIGSGGSGEPVEAVRADDVTMGQSPRFPGLEVGVGGSEGTFCVQTVLLPLSRLAKATIKCAKSSCRCFVVESD